MRFPQNFLWGAGTSAHQVEGNNIYSDWFHFEKEDKIKEKSEEATKHYDFFKEDFDLAKSLNHNCHRFSIEWSRIQPQENKFEESQISHYKEVVSELRLRNLEPVVTLHHFTNPLWFIRKEGFLERENIKYFLRYLERIVSEIGRDVLYWITINEPVVYIYNSYFRGIWPPQEKSFIKAKRVFKNFIRTHIQSYRLIHKIYKENSWEIPKIGIAKNFRIFSPCPYRNYPLNKFSSKLRDRYFNRLFLERIKDYLDFIGVNYYTREFVRFKLIFGEEYKDLSHQHIKRKNSLGWEVYPEGILEVLRSLKRYNLPILITENGTTELNTFDYWYFLKEHLNYIYLAIQEGINVIGYIWWSLLDNFEWDKGFQAKFGLIEVDRVNYRRKIKDFAWKFSEVCKKNELNV